jgi:hypothetical protein
LDDQQEASTDDGAIAFEIDGQRYELNIRRLTPQDAVACRKAVGLSVAGVLRAMDEDPDIDIIAALVWLARRSRGERSLTFKEVARDINYDTALTEAAKVIDVGVTGEEADLPDPEQSGGNS